MPTTQAIVRRSHTTSFTFTDKPSQETRTALVAAGFQFDAKSRQWYRREEESHFRTQRRGNKAPPLRLNRSGSSGRSKCHDHRLTLLATRGGVLDGRYTPAMAIRDGDGRKAEESKSKRCHETQNMDIQSCYCCLEASKNSCFDAAIASD